MLCDCFEKVNDLLKEQGRQLDLAFSLEGGQPALNIPTVPIEGTRKKQKARLVAGYCPFCGAELATRKRTPGSSGR
jgi:hypothetical protein